MFKHGGYLIDATYSEGLRRSGGGPPGTRGLRGQAAAAATEDGRRDVEPGVLSEHVSGEGQSCVRQVEAGGARGLLGFVFSVDSSHGHFVYNRLCLQTNTRNCPFYPAQT